MVEGGGRGFGTAEGFTCSTNRGWQAWEAKWGRRGPEGAADLMWTERGVDLRGHLGAGLEGFREQASMAVCGFAGQGVKGRVWLCRTVSPPL